jgi:hypothetical protein
MLRRLSAREIHDAACNATRPVMSYAPQLTIPYAVWTTTTVRVPTVRGANGYYLDRHAHTSSGALTGTTSTGTPV